MSDLIQRLRCKSTLPCSDPILDEAADALEKGYRRIEVTKKFFRTLLEVLNVCMEEMEKIDAA